MPRTPMPHLAAMTLRCAVPASAGCLTAANLAPGITFTRAGLAMADGDHVTAKASAWTGQRTTRLGGYEQSANFPFNEEMTLGSGSPDCEWTFAKSPPIPTSGTTFQTRVKQGRDANIGTEFPNPPDIDTCTPTCTVVARSQGKLSSCTCAAIPGKAVFTFATDTATQRWLYFSDLGFGIETRSRSFTTGKPQTRGLTTLKARK